MSTESQKGIVWLFMSALAVMALIINVSLSGVGRGSWKSSDATSSRIILPSVIPTVTQVTAPVTGSAPMGAQSSVVQVDTVARAQQAERDVAAEHARFLERYLNSGFSRQSGIRTVAIVAASEDGKLNNALSAALATHFKTDSSKMISSFFKPTFVADKLFGEIFAGSAEAINQLELTKSLDMLLMARQSVQYSINPSLENVMTANMRVEIVTVSLSSNGQSETVTFIANGAGFSRADARSLAEERIFKQIASDTKLSLSQ